MFDHDIIPPKTPPNPDLDKIKHPKQVEVQLDLDLIITKLLELKKSPLERGEITEESVKAMCFLSRQVYANQPLLLEIKGSLIVVGDLHGQFHDLLRIFEAVGNPSTKAFLFLGDYVDRGHQGLEIIVLLLAYQLKYPRRVYLLRGNHENPELNRYYGFLTELEERFGVKALKVWKSLTRMFQEMPLAALVEESIFCVHGGISPIMMDKDFISLHTEFGNIPRPVNIETTGFPCDLLWSDPMDKPDEECKGWEPNDRGISYAFGIDVVDSFCEKFNINLIIRGHQVVEDGYDFYAKRKLVTIFSAPGYCGTYDNAGGIIILEKSDDLLNNGNILRAKFMIIKPEKRFATTKWYHDNCFEVATNQSK